MALCCAFLCVYLVVNFCLSNGANGLDRKTLENGENVSKREGLPSLDIKRLKKGRPDIGTIGEDDCTFILAKDGCRVTATPDACVNGADFGKVWSHIFPTENLEKGTDGFINGDKFECLSITISQCNRKFNISFEVKSRDAFTAIDGILTISDLMIRISLDFDKVGKPETVLPLIRRMIWNGGGTTKFANSDRNIRIHKQSLFSTVEYYIADDSKQMSGEDYLAGFGVDKNGLNSMSTTMESSNVNIDSIVFENSDLSCYLQIDEAFECLLCGGKVTSGALSTAKDICLLVQRYNEEDEVPRGAMIAEFGSAVISDLVSAMSRVQTSGIGSLSYTKDALLTLSASTFAFINIKKSRREFKRIVYREYRKSIDEGLILNFKVLTEESYDVIKKIPAANFTEEYGVKVIIEENSLEVQYPKAIPGKRNELFTIISDDSKAYKFSEKILEQSKMELTGFKIEGGEPESILTANIRLVGITPLQPNLVIIPSANFDYMARDFGTAVGHYWIPISPVNTTLLQRQVEFNFDSKLNDENKVETKIIGHADIFSSSVFEEELNVTFMKLLPNENGKDITLSGVTFEKNLLEVIFKPLAFSSNVQILGKNVTLRGFLSNNDNGPEISIKLEIREIKLKNLLSWVMEEDDTLTSEWIIIRNAELYVTPPSNDDIGQGWGIDSSGVRIFGDISFSADCDRQGLCKFFRAHFNPEEFRIDCRLAENEFECSSLFKADGVRLEQYDLTFTFCGLSIETEKSPQVSIYGSAVITEKQVTCSFRIYEDNMGELIGRIWTSSIYEHLFGYQFLHMASNSSAMLDLKNKESRVIVFHGKIILGNKVNGASNLLTNNITVSVDVQNPMKGNMKSYLNVRKIDELSIAFDTFIPENGFILDLEFADNIEFTYGPYNQDDQRESNVHLLQDQANGLKFRGTTMFNGVSTPILIIVPRYRLFVPTIFLDWKTFTKNNGRIRFSPSGCGKTKQNLTLSAKIVDSEEVVTFHASVKALGMSYCGGISVLEDRSFVFPLKGKLLNVMPSNLMMKSTWNGVFDDLSFEVEGEWKRSELGGISDNIKNVLNVMGDKIAYLLEIGLKNDHANLELTNEIFERQSNVIRLIEDIDRKVEYTEADMVALSKNISTKCWKECGVVCTPGVVANTTCLGRPTMNNENPGSCIIWDKCLIKIPDTKCISECEMKNLDVAEEIFKKRGNVKSLYLRRKGETVMEESYRNSYEVAKELFNTGLDWLTTVSEKFNYIDKLVQCVKKVNKDFFQLKLLKLKSNLNDVNAPWVKLRFNVLLCGEEIEAKKRVLINGDYMKNLAEVIIKEKYPQMSDVDEEIAAVMSAFHQFKNMREEIKSTFAHRMDYVYDFIKPFSIVVTNIAERPPRVEKANQNIDPVVKKYTIMSYGTTKAFRAKRAAEMYIDRGLSAVMKAQPIKQKREEAHSASRSSIQNLYTPVTDILQKFYNSASYAMRMNEIENVKRRASLVEQTNKRMNNAHQRSIKGIPKGRSNYWTIIHRKDTYNWIKRSKLMIEEKAKIVLDKIKHEMHLTDVNGNKRTIQAHVKDLGARQTCSKGKRSSLSSSRAAKVNKDLMSVLNWTNPDHAKIIIDRVKRNVAKGLQHCS